MKTFHPAMRPIFYRPLPWPARHPYACLWFLLIAFGVVGRIDIDAATRRSDEAQRLAALQRECARAHAQVTDEMALACAPFQRGRPSKRLRM